jgi:hypothetical protein
MQDLEFCFWLREPGRDGRSEQVEGAGVDRGGHGDFLDLLPVEIDDLPVQCRKVLKKVAVTDQALTRSQSPATAPRPLGLGGAKRCFLVENYDDPEGPTQLARHHPHQNGK